MDEENLIYYIVSFGDVSLARMEIDPNLQWGLVEGHILVPESKCWSKIQLAWKKLNRRISGCSRDSPAEAMSPSLWWNHKYKGSQLNISKNQACSLYLKGVRLVRDVWNSSEGRVKSEDEMISDFQLSKKEGCTLRQLLLEVEDSLEQTLRSLDEVLRPSQWIGAFSKSEDLDPELIMTTTSEWNPTTTADRQ